MPRSFRDHDSESEEDDDDEIVFDVSKYDFIDDDNDDQEDNMVAVAKDNDDQPSETINPPEKSKPPEQNNPSLSSKNTSKTVDEKLKSIPSVSNLGINCLKLIFIVKSKYK
jgi:hypothetical protein